MQWAAGPRFGEVMPHFFTLLRRWFCDAGRDRGPATGRRLRVGRSCSGRTSPAAGEATSGGLRRPGAGSAASWEGSWAVSAAAEPVDEFFRQTAFERASGWAGSCVLSANLTEDQIAKWAGALKSLKSNDLSGLVRNLLCVSRVDQPSDFARRRSHA